MNPRNIVAVGVALLTMLLALVQPLWIELTGEEIALDIQPVDPLSLFRGNYVDLTYNIDAPVPSELERGDLVFVVFDDSHPARPLRVLANRPDLAKNESCVRGQVGDGQTVFLPSLEQFFVTPDQGSRIERDLANMVAIVKTTTSCRAIITAIEPE